MKWIIFSLFVFMNLNSRVETEERGKTTKKKKNKKNMVIINYIKKRKEQLEILYCPQALNFPANIFQFSTILFFLHSFLLYFNFNFFVFVHHFQMTLCLSFIINDSRCWCWCCYTVFYYIVHPQIWKSNMFVLYLCGVYCIVSIRPFMYVCICICVCVLLLCFYKFTSMSLSAKNFFNCCERFSRANCFSFRSNISDSKSSKRALVAFARNDAELSSSDTFVFAKALHFVTDNGSLASSSRRLVN